MPTRSRLRRWSGQPQGVIGPSPSLWSDALVWSATNPTLALGAAQLLGTEGSPSVRTGAPGIGRSWSRNANAGTTFGTFQHVTGLEITVAVVAAPVASTNRKTAFSQRISASNAAQFWCAFNIDGSTSGGALSGGIGLVSRNTAVSGGSLGASSQFDGLPHAWVLANGVNEGYVYRDGVAQTASPSSRATGTVWTSAQVTRIGNVGDYATDGLFVCDDPIYLVIVWPRVLPADYAQWLSADLASNLSSAFADHRVFVPVSAGGDVTVALSGSAVTSSAGALAPSASVSVSGSASTASAGTLASTASLALTGSSVTSSAGTLTPSLSVALSGQSVTSSAGTLTANTGSDVTVALSGAAVTVSAGMVAPSATTTLSGSAVTGAAGTVSPGLSVALSGASSTSTAGTLTASTSQDVTVALTGSAVTVSAGTLTPSGGDTPSVNPGWGGGAVGGGGKGLRELTARIAKDAEDLLERKRKAPNAQTEQPAALESAPALTRKTSSRGAGSSESADRVAAEPAAPGSQAEVLSELRSLRGAVEKLEALILADREEARKRREQDEEEAAVVKLLLN